MKRSRANRCSADF